jgi:AsmA protein
MKRALLIGLGAALSIVALIVALPFLIPLSTYRGEIEAQATKATGRTVKIDGPLRISLFPIGLRADNASVASIPGSAHRNLAETESVQVAVALAPLLSGHIVVSEILLIHPQIYLDVDKAGVSNWSLGKSGVSSGNTSFIRFVHVKVEDGSVHYFSALSGSENSLAHFNVDLNMPGSGKLAAEGSFAEKDKTISFESTIDKFDALSSGAQSPAHIALKSDVLKAGFDGMMSREGDADGDLSLDTPSLRTVADIFGHPLAPGGGGFGPFMLRSHFHAHDKVYALTSTMLALDAIEAKGQFSLDMRDKLPMLTGTLSASRLDLNPYLGGAGNAGALDSGWSRKPISLSVLADANAYLVLRATSLTVRNLKIANADLEVNVKDSKLSAMLNRIGLYGGQGQAMLMVDASGPVPTFENHLTFVNMQMAPFLGDTIGVNRIQGAGNIRLDVVAHGHSAGDVMNSLSGKGAVSVRNGQIRGVDLGMIARTVQTIVGGGAKSDSATTGFSTFGGTFGLKNGVATCNDLALSGPLLTMTGHGALGIGDRTIDFHLVPKAGIGSKASNAIGLAVPIHITGTWDHLNYGPDLAGVVDSVIGNIENGGNAIKGLFGGSSGSNSKPQGGKKSQSVGDSVKNLFGIH